MKSCDFLMKHANLHPVGIQHVVECSALVDLLENWNAATNEEKEGAEQTIKDLFGNDLKLIFVPALKVEEEKREELKKNMKEWNRSHTMKVMAQLQTRPDEWSDREMAAGSKLTGISIKKSES